MYQISPTFQKILDSRTGRNRSIVWWGTLDLENGTHHDLDASILSQGTGSLSSVCDLPGIGGAYSTEFQSQLFLAVDPRALKGAEIKLYVRLHAPAPLPGETTWEDLKDFEWLDLESVTWDMDGQSVYTDIPMGVFYIADAKRAINSIKIEAYDGMQKTNTDLPAMDSKSRTPFEWLRWICNACGLELGLNKVQVTEFPNGSRSFTYADIDTEVTQYRHVLSHLAAALGAIAVMDRYGKLSLARIGKEAVAEITPDTRFSSEYMDTQSYYTGLSLSYKAKALQEYYKNVGTLEDNGLIIDIGANVFLQISKDSNRAAAAQAIVDSHKGITFTPYDATIPFNPAFDLLDVLAFTGGHAPTDSHGPITSIVRQIGGAMTVQCATPEELTNPVRETVKTTGVSGAASLSGTMYASSDFWIMIDSYPDEESIIGDDTLTTELTVNCTVDNTCMQIAWTGAYTLDEAATVIAKILVDDELIYEVSDDQTAGNHILNVTTGYNVNTQGEHTVKVILREDVL